MNFFLATLVILTSVLLLVDGQFQPRTSPARNVIFRPMTRNFGRVGRRGPVAPAPFHFQAPHKASHPPGFKPPLGVAKKLNEAIDFRALARVLLKQ